MVKTIFSTKALSNYYKILALKTSRISAHITEKNGLACKTINIYIENVSLSSFLIKMGFSNVPKTKT